jgi:hypothetical protein
MFVRYYDVAPATLPSTQTMSMSSREQRLRDGRLVDISRIACEAGFRAPVAISKEALNSCLLDLPEATSGNSSSCTAAWRLWSVLWAAAAEAMHRHEDREILFSACLDRADPSTQIPVEVHLKLVIDWGTNDRPVATIVLPDQE